MPSLLDFNDRDRAITANTYTAVLRRPSVVHTFVRDARLTTAGLRGSRVAELIDALAALNQTEPDVAELFTS